MMALAEDLALALDPVALARKVGLEPDAWQADVLRSTAPRMLLNCSRQSGKSTVTGILATHTALFEPGSLTLLLSPSQRQSQELFRKALNVYREAGRPVPPDAESALRLELETGSRVVALPGKDASIRGFSGVGLLVVDEASRVPDELYYAVRPMLAVSGGRLMLLSTPFGKRGFFYDSWRSQEPWRRYDVPATMCPRIPAEFLAEERRTMGADRFAQEYECMFTDSERSPFGADEVRAAFAEEVSAWSL